MQLIISLFSQVSLCFVSDVGPANDWKRRLVNADALSHQTQKVACEA